PLSSFKTGFVSMRRSEGPGGSQRQNDPRQAAPSLRLYHSLWSEERALLSCAWSDDAAVIRSYLSLCQERTDEFSDHQDENFNTNFIFAPEEMCVSVTSPGVTEGAERAGRRPVRSVGARSPSENPDGQGERSGVERHRRVKRGFIVPGTLWCGSGNKAPSYADLGVFSDTDSCCREHDQCKHTILSFQSNFGVFNSNIFTMSHCSCDNRFRSCLMDAKDSISDVVGYTFFNLLKMHCFEFSHRLQCAERNWFGMCKETKMALYAVVHPPTLYETDESTEISGNDTTIINATVTTQAATEAPENSTSDVQLFAVSGAASTVPTVSPGSSTAPVTPTANADKRLSCDIYQDLDKCKSKIPPQQRRYGLHNPEPRTLYHCNCTTRLFQSLAEQRELTEVQALLVGHVSQSCFLAQDCLPQLEERRDMEEQRHLQAIKLQVRRPNSKRAKRKERAIKLQKLCLRLTKAKLHRNRKAYSHGA
uniref:phospholipase A2 n=1 Tax=Myripristis murdjan TaxID=586833 RepID=A0A667Z300_9TELE